LLQYCVTKEAVGKFVSFKCTPVRDDGIVGEARSFIGKDRVTPGASVFFFLKIFMNGRYYSVSQKRDSSLFAWLDDKKKTRHDKKNMFGN